jgi:hypothetical protein
MFDGVQVNWQAVSLFVLELLSDIAESSSPHAGAFSWAGTIVRLQATRGRRMSHVSLGMDMPVNKRGLAVIPPTPIATLSQTSQTRPTQAFKYCWVNLALCAEGLSWAGAIVRLEAT